MKPAAITLTPIAYELQTDNFYYVTHQYKDKWSVVRRPFRDSPVPTHMIMTNDGWKAVLVITREITREFDDIKAVEKFLRKQP